MHSQASLNAGARVDMPNQCMSGLSDFAHDQREGCYGGLTSDMLRLLAPFTPLLGYREWGPSIFSASPGMSRLRGYLCADVDAAVAGLHVSLGQQFRQVGDVVHP